MAKIAFVRHGQSVWNKKNLWTGWTDVELTDDGRREAKLAASMLRDIDFDNFFTSDLVRAIETLEIIRKELDKTSIPVVVHPSLKERHYGEFTGKDKWEIRKIVGAEKFIKIRRGWRFPIKDGETLEDVYNRVVPYFEQNILPLLKSDKNVLLVAHGNSIRALIKHLDNISDEGIEEIELTTGEIVIYEIDRMGKVKNSLKRRQKK